MSGPIEAVGALSGAQFAPGIEALSAPPAGSAGSFGQMLMNGVEGVNRKLIEADAAVTQFAVDDSVPLHQVTYALEQSRLSFELMLQVRTRLLESYQELMRMSL